MADVSTDPTATDVTAGAARHRRRRKRSTNSNSQAPGETMTPPATQEASPSPSVALPPSGAPAAAVPLPPAPTPSAGPPTASSAAVGRSFVSPRRSVPMKETPQPLADYIHRVSDEIIEDTVDNSVMFNDLPCVATPSAGADGAMALQQPPPRPQPELFDENKHVAMYYVETSNGNFQRMTKAQLYERFGEKDAANAVAGPRAHQVFTTFNMNLAKGFQRFLASASIFLAGLIAGVCTMQAVILLICKETVLLQFAERNLPVIIETMRFMDYFNIYLSAVALFILTICGTFILDRYDVACLTFETWSQAASFSNGAVYITLVYCVAIALSGVIFTFDEVHQDLKLMDVKAVDVMSVRRPYRLGVRGPNATKALLGDVYNVHGEIIFGSYVDPTVESFDTFVRLIVARAAVCVVGWLLIASNPAVNDQVQRLADSIEAETAEDKLQQTKLANGNGNGVTNGQSHVSVDSGHPT